MASAKWREGARGNEKNPVGGDYSLCVPGTVLGLYVIILSSRQPREVDTNTQTAQVNKPRVTGVKQLAPSHTFS